MATKQMDAKTVHEKIADRASKSDKRTRKPKFPQNGNWVRQGDIYVIRQDGAAKGLKLTKERQLATGTSQGSRHVVVGDKIKVYGRENRDGFTGPVIEVCAGTATVTHPEHAHVELPVGVYEVRHQEDLSTRRAVQD